MEAPYTTDEGLKVTTVILWLVAGVLVCWCLVTVYVLLFHGVRSARPGSIIPFPEAFDLIVRGVETILLQLQAGLIWSPSFWSSLSLLSSVAAISVLSLLAGLCTIFSSWRRGSELFLFVGIALVCAFLLGSTFVALIAAKPALPG